MRQYITFRFLSWLFQIPKSTSHNYINIGINLIFEKFKNQDKLPSKEILNLYKSKFRNQDVHYVIDGVEQKIVNFVDKEKNINCYSGKKKSCTVTKLVYVSPKGHIYKVCESFEGCCCC